jgi:RNA polymerase sigma-70 factor (ECF subfamily)
MDLYLDPVWRTLRGLGVPPATADDAAQEVFVIALQRLPTIVMGSERSFLLGTAVRVAANHRRKLARSRVISGAAEIAEPPDPAPGPEELAALGEQRAILESVLSQMPDELRAVFVLFELEGLSSAEIGQILGIPTGTVASRLRRARADFHARVGGGDAGGAP